MAKTRWWVDTADWLGRRHRLPAINRDGAEILEDQIAATRATILPGRRADFARGTVRGWLEAAGLRNVTVEDLGAACSATSERENCRAEISIFLARGERRSNWVRRSPPPHKRSR